MGQSAVYIHPLSGAIDSHRRQQHRHHQGAEIHGRLLPAAASSRAMVSPAATESAEESHTAGRMSKGVRQPAAARTEAMVAGSS